MISLVYKRFIQSSFSRTIRRNGQVGSGIAQFASDEGGGFSRGLKWALAGNGVNVKDKAFRNLEPSELQQKGAVITGSLSGLPIYFRRNVAGSALELSKAQFSKLLIQVITHLSSVSNIFVHDGAIGWSKFDAKVRMISDCPTAVLRLLSVLWKTSARAISHDSCPITVYVATSISPEVREVVSLGAQGSGDFIAADVERSSLILCGKAFADRNGTLEALAALSGPVILARGGLLLSGRLLVSNGSIVLLFAPEDTIRSCEDRLISPQAGVVLSSQGVAPLFRTGNPDSPNLFDLPAAIILVCSDSSGTIPSLSRLSPGQAAYHYLAGYQDGEFLPAYIKGPSSVDSLELVQSLLSKLKDHQIPTYMVNMKGREMTASGKSFLKLVDSALSGMVRSFESKGTDLERKFRSILRAKFKEVPEDFSF